MIARRPSADFPLRVVAEIERAWLNGDTDAVPPPRVLTPAEKAARQAEIERSIDERWADVMARADAERHAAIDGDPQLREQYQEITGEAFPAWDRSYAERWRANSALIPSDRVDAADLVAADIPPLRWIVPDLIPEGTTAIAAPPKVGKSCLIYQVAVEIAIGGEVLGRRVQPGSVLYMALEDGQRRGRDRLVAALAGRTMPRGRLEVRWSAPRIGEGLEEQIAAWLAEHPDAAMVAIDTLGRVRPQASGKRNPYDVDVEDLGRLQTMFRDRAIALVIVHHARKAASDDFLTSVSGTYGITGSVDTIVVVQRKRLEAFGTIVATGRDTKDVEIAVRFDNLLWHAAAPSLPEASFERAEVYRVIEEQGPIFPKGIIDRLGLAPEKRTSVQHMIEKLVDAGAVVRAAKGYVVANVSIHSTHSISEQSEWGTYNARGAREADEDSTIEVVDCRAYAEHRSSHHWTSAGWVCDRCRSVA